MHIIKKLLYTGASLIIMLAADPAFAGGKTAPMPEPGTLLLLGSGLMGVALYRRIKNK